MIASRFTWSCTLLLVVACAKENATPGAKRMDPIAPVRSDSAGVVMMVHGAGAYEQAPDVEIDTLAMVVMHGSVDNPDEDISTVDPVLFLADGRLIGIDRQRQQVMVFSADGGTRVAFGRKGNGPGEFGVHHGVIPAGGDSLLVFDPVNAAGDDPPSRHRTGAGVSARRGDRGRRQRRRGAGGRAAADVGLNISEQRRSAARGQGRGARPREQQRRAGLHHRAGRAGRGEAASGHHRERQPSWRCGPWRVKPLSRFPEAFGWQRHFVVADGNHLRFAIRDLGGKVIAVLRVDRPRVAGHSTRSGRPTSTQQVRRHRRGNRCGRRAGGDRWRRGRPTGHGRRATADGR